MFHSCILLDIISERKSNLKVHKHIMNQRIWSSTNMKSNTQLDIPTYRVTGTARMYTC